MSFWVLLLSQSKRKEVPDEKGNFKKIFFNLLHSFIYTRQEYKMKNPIRKG